jgi:hypothetical protein
MVYWSPKPRVVGSIPASAPIQRKSLIHQGFFVLALTATSPCYKGVCFMSSHPFRRGGLWWARLVLPTRLRDAAGRREFSQSTKTHEVHIAKLVASILVANWRRQLLALECCPMTPDILKLIGPASALTAANRSFSRVNWHQTGRAVEAFSRWPDAAVLPCVSSDGICPFD